MKMLYSSLKLYLCTLSTYASEVGSDAKQIISEHVTDLQAYLIGWLQRPDIGFGVSFGGKNDKIRDEIKVCAYIQMIKKFKI